MEGGGGGGGPAPFLLKTYEMVDDSATDHIVSWSPSKTSFVVWDAPEFSRLLLPTYFKHNNFSSFIRQLNTYGFRKIDPEKWEFANDEFAKDKKHLLRNIHRRKPIHSHSLPPAGSIDPERAALEEEIDQLAKEKAALQSDLFRFRQQHTGTKSQLEELDRRVKGMEERQIKMMTFLGKAVHNPTFVEHLIRMSNTASIDFAAFNKKRRQLPRDGGSDGLHEHLDNSSSDEHCNTPKSTDFGHIFHQDISSKLNLELSPAFSGMNLVSVNARSCKEDATSTQRRQSVGVQARIECLSFVPEAAELMDTGASLCPRKSNSLSWPRAADETDGQVLCHLNLTLASSPLQIDRGIYSNRDSNSSNKDVDAPSEIRPAKEQGLHDTAGRDQKSVSDGNKKVESSKDFTKNGNQGPKPASGRVNDLFWEQFLTERPGSMDNEEASSSLRPNPQEEPKEDRNAGDAWRSKKDTEKLTL